MFQSLIFLAKLPYTRFGYSVFTSDSLTSSKIFSLIIELLEINILWFAELSEPKIFCSLSSLKYVKSFSELKGRVYVDHFN